MDSNILSLMYDTAPALVEYTDVTLVADITTTAARATEAAIALLTETKLTMTSSNVCIVFIVVESLGSGKLVYSVFPSRAITMRSAFGANIVFH